MEVDSSRLRRLAAAVREEAVRVRGAARRLDAVRDVVWHSPAGALFRDRVGERVHALRVTATRLDSAADHLDAHAGQVDAALAALASAAGAAAHAVDEVGRTVRRGLDG
ncbi:hypothetical protein RKE38_11380 [Phycicoccus sp. M110.8]|uniref:hypothetical protein n=1 Tax=Phycicoccus sp. M110.8 TaxID=3075433 RepID=UPI0028FDBE5A|nr:hypothetical protein [Phycicoccus sp. M110.8]MDU0314290.1 hypothetical protein [Phycicoccus sp. M110.8]